MNKYESIFVINPKLAEEKRKELIEKVKGIIASGGGKLLSLEEWGVRRLAYPAKGCQEGYYCLLNLEAIPSVIESLERNYRTIEEIIKYLSVRIEERKPKKVKPKKYRPRIQEKKEYYERRGGRERWRE
ncbi:30S ribosomal protein S6 [bacterium]|nr:30S ribosomal protein S6 [bacterium]MBU4561170.1 30S ribosomal protein S6 [bacterium]MCG2676521.1 30S ribosomal protein S6 [bacterium]MCG2678014.1 30S ribosomal protein S6 [bacterium]